MVRLRGRLHGQVMGFVRWVKQRFMGGEGAEEEPELREEFRMESISPNLVVIPESGNVEAVDVRYPLIEPFADAHIYWDGDQSSCSKSSAAELMQ